ncbi:MAG TPA: ABC transporter ATP-binding protein [Polyangiaceae bacterium]|nr:ABC transporter ATP-binding protein [Polyangiaceae bacterium]
MKARRPDGAVALAEGADFGHDEARERSRAEVTIATSVSVQAVRHHFDDKPILDGIDLDVEGGAFVALLGPSGCGKSTLLRLIAGLDTPSEGTIRVEHDGAPGAPGRTAFVFQDAHLLPWRTVLDNVALPLELRGVARDEARRRARAPLAEVELADDVSAFPDQLSGGMRMRVSIARALVTEPSLLLLDEPFAALDELTRLRLDERLRALWERRRMTVLFVTHSLSEATFLSNRAIVLSKRPAKIVLYRVLALPNERDAPLRATPAFSHEVAALYDALEKHGGLDDRRVS